LVGGPFKIGDNPKVDAQFNIQYCVANALLRKSSKLPHFDESYIRDPEIMQLIKKINVSDDPALEDPKRFVFTVGARVRVTARQGGIFDKSVDIPRGFPGNPLTQEEHMERFQDCVKYSDRHLPKGNIEKMISLVERLEKTKDIRTLMPLLLVKGKRK
jgi:2-methylcitrate dehydratase PrpD